MMDKKVRVFRVIISLAFAASLAILSSCEKYVWTVPEPPVIPEDVIISFDQHIYPKCSSCHSSWSNSKIYDKLSANVDTINPDNSHIFVIHSSVGNFNTMIQVNDTLQLGFVDVIKTWASQGAKDNK
jgi:hypothetical protein